MNRFGTKRFWLLGMLAVVGMAVQADDWPIWGRTPARNMVSLEKGLPVSFEPGKKKAGSEEIDMATTKNIRWVIKLGSQSYGNPTVSGGKIFVGTNNETPRDPRLTDDRGVIMCFDEKSGEFLWQFTAPKLGSGKVNDWEYLGICSSPAVGGNRVYFVSNRCEVVCLDVNGLKDGNQGFQGEAKYTLPDGDGSWQPGEKDADIVWFFDMRDELGVFPHNISSSSVLLAGDKVFVTTSNGQDWSHVNIPNPKAPTLVVLDQATGKLIGEEASAISTRLYHCNWSSPSFGKVKDQPLVFFGAGDGFCYAFKPDPVKDEDGFGILEEVWRYECNPPSYKVKDGQKIRYPSPKGPSEVIATPVFYKDRIYVATGQDPEHGSGIGILSCIKADGKGDVTETGALWTYDKIERSISTVAVYKDLVFAADFTGFLHCLDADTGKVYWVHDTESNIWSSPLVAGGKVYQGNEDGLLIVLDAAKKENVVTKIEFDAPIYASPIAANGTLYISTQTHLYAAQAVK